jgi:hypothetical protein
MLGKENMLDFLKDVLKIALDAIIKLVAFFAVGTGGAAVVCWYYGMPLGFSILGGILVLGVALALMSDSTWW